MDIELKQVEYSENFTQQASNLEGESLMKIIVEATSHPSLFAFSEILAVPSVVELKGTEHGIFVDLLNIFAHGTWSDYKKIHARLPPLVPEQVLKLKQLTLLTLAETDKVLPYEALMKELDVANVRELEDFLIDDCMYVGIVKGKLDQLRRCFQVQFALGRDPRPGKLSSMIDMLSNWLSTSDDLGISIQDKIKWADDMSGIDQAHRIEVGKRLDEVQKTLSLKEYNEVPGNKAYLSEYDGLAQFEENLIRTKRIRRPIVFEEKTLLSGDDECNELIARVFGPEESL